MAEWWLVTYTDGAWSFSHYIAGLTALKAIEEVAVELGLKAGSLDASKLSGFVLSRVSDFRIYEVYQKAGFDMAAAKKFILEVIQDSSKYEVKN